MSSLVNALGVSLLLTGASRSLPDLFLTSFLAQFELKIFFYSFFLLYCIMENFEVRDKFFGMRDKS